MREHHPASVDEGCADVGNLGSPLDGGLRQHLAALNQ